MQYPSEPHRPSTPLTPAPPIVLPETVRETVIVRKRPVIGTRGILLILVACLLLALAPTAARFGDDGAESSVGAYRPEGGTAVELAEANFPGSAFYYLDPSDDGHIDYGAAGAEGLPADYPAGVDGAALPITGEGDGTAASGPQYSLPGVGAVARPFVMAARGRDYDRALQCLTDAIYYEAGTEPDVGQRAVAQVILNRVRHPSYPDTVCGVIYQGSERATGCQFSYSCDGSMRRTPNGFHYQRARRAAASALAGSVYAPVGLATHYHATYVNPYWAPSLRYLGTIGLHRFYTFKGSAGNASAFFRRHAGAEPFPGPKPRAYTPAPAQQSLDPVKLQAQYEREYAEARAKAEAAAKASAASNPAHSAVAVGFNPDKPVAAPRYDAPQYSASAKARGGEDAYAGQKLPQSGTVKSEYANSGTWKERPAE